jgi:tetratricopeptide (TPR) repeat protein
MRPVRESNRVTGAWRHRRHRLAISVTAGAVGLVVAAASAAENEPAGPQTTFYHANALYKDGRYADAVREYEGLLQSGLESGPLYFNLGNAYFKAGEYGRAILNYERAARLIPRDPDLLANLSYAQALSEATTCEAPAWQRLLFPLADRLSFWNLAVATAATNTLLCLVLALYIVSRQRPRWLLYVAAALGVFLSISAASLGYRTLASRTPAAVVTRGGETAVRFEPADSGTPHYVLKEGSVVRVLETRDGWLQVSRCDGRRGWIEHAAVEAVQRAP